MNKTSPGARFIRTFLQLMSGVLASVALIDWWTNWRAGAIALTLGIISAALGALIAFFMAIAGWHVASAWGKGVVTFAQLMAAGLVTLGVTEWTSAAFIVFGQSFLRLLLASVVAAVGAAWQNAAEQGTLGARNIAIH